MNVFAVSPIFRDEYDKKLQVWPKSRD